jgi:hypothetical protein
MRWWKIIFVRQRNYNRSIAFIKYRSRELCLSASSCWILAWPTLRTWRRRQRLPPKRRWTSTGLQAVTSQKTVFCSILFCFFFSEILAELLWTDCRLETVRNGHSSEVLHDESANPRCEGLQGVKEFLHGHVVEAVVINSESADW